MMNHKIFNDPDDRSNYNDPLLDQINLDDDEDDLEDGDEDEDEDEEDAWSDDEDDDYFEQERPWKIRWPDGRNANEWY